MRSWPAPSVPPLPAAAAQPLRLFDSAAGAQKVVPGDDRTDPGAPATLYVCGITPYDATHLGHAATYLAFDLVQRYWLAMGRTVRYVQNVTDVDDPLLERAERDGVPWQELAASQIDLFRSDMSALRMLPPQHYVAVSEETADIAAAVQQLLDSGAAYRLAAEDYPDVYFDIGATGRFGYESRLDSAAMLALAAERGGDPDRPGKKNPLDPLIWRLARPGEPRWPAAMGAGRPGWHIECSVIAQKYLAPTIDVQGGGNDLIFPHHESSAAHAEELAGVERFSGAYVHAGMLGYRGEKMSKSLGNLVFVSSLVASGSDPMAIRLALLADHYRADREWTDERLAAAGDRLHRWRVAAARSGDPADAVIADVTAALSADLDTPRALSLLDAWATAENLAGDAVARSVDALLGIKLR